MGRRIYAANFDNATVSAAGDLITLKTPAAQGAQIHHIQLSAGGVSAAAEIRLALKRSTGTIGGGTGGTSMTIATIDVADQRSAGCTAALLPSAATTATTFVFLEYFQWNVLLPFDYMPGPEDEDRDVADVSSALVLVALGSPTSTAVSGFMKWREMP